ncbi:uncharacterized protein [Dermacentor albipictus]|uniref:uncharacterized protein n=1 Tax=Dermacentor albipictus TaxID=60249 RepID=UPI0038FC5065
MSRRCVAAAVVLALYLTYLKECLENRECLSKKSGRQFFTTVSMVITYSQRPQLFVVAFSAYTIAHGWLMIETVAQVDLWPPNATAWSAIRRFLMKVAVLMELAMPLIAVFPAEGSHLHYVFTSVYGMGTHLALLTFYFERRALPGAAAIEGALMWLRAFVFIHGTSLLIMALGFAVHTGGYEYCKFLNYSPCPTD